MKPNPDHITKSRLNSRLRECSRDSAAFLKTYARNRNSRSHWLLYRGQLLPAKAVFAASHDPVLLPRSFNTSDCYGLASKFKLPLIVTDAAKQNTSRSAAADIPDEVGNSDPEYRKRMSGYYVRVKAVRDAVLDRASGKCEHCGESGFKKRDGTRYLETHHIISLNEQGPDTRENVIALCANDHRAAHFGEQWAQLQDQFKSKITALEKRS